jgi:hypothetical protein
MSQSQCLLAAAAHHAARSRKAVRSRLWHLRCLRKRFDEFFATSRPQYASETLRAAGVLSSVRNLRRSALSPAFEMDGSTASLSAFLSTCSFVTPAHDTAPSGACQLCRAAVTAPTINSSSSTISPASASAPLHMIASLSAMPPGAPLLFTSNLQTLDDVPPRASSVFHVAITTGGLFCADSRCYALCAGTAKSVAFVPAPDSSESLPSPIVDVRAADTAPTRRAYVPASIVVDFPFYQWRLWLDKSDAVAEGDAGADDMDKDAADDDDDDERGANGIDMQERRRDEVILRELSSALNALLTPQTVGVASSDSGSGSTLLAAPSCADLRVRAVLAGGGLATEHDIEAQLEMFTQRAAMFDFPDAFPYTAAAVRRQRCADRVGDAFIGALAALETVDRWSVVGGGTESVDVCAARNEGQGSRDGDGDGDEDGAGARLLRADEGSGIGTGIAAVDPRAIAALLEVRCCC